MKKLISLFLITCMLIGPTCFAEEVAPSSTNIIDLNATLLKGDGYLLGSVTATFTGTGLHSIHECHIQYQTSTGAWYNVDDGRTSRCYNPGEPYTTNVYYYSPEVGTTYRFHVYMRVVDSDGYLHDASVTNSNVYTYTG